MHNRTFQYQTGFLPYKSPEDTKQIIYATLGIANEYTKLIDSTHDANRLNHASRIFHYIAGLCNITGKSFSLKLKTQWLPDYFYDVKKIGQSIAELTDICMEWLAGEEYLSEKVGYHIDIILASLINLCEIYKINPFKALTIAALSIEENLKKIKESKLREPLLWGRKLTKEEASNSHDKYLAYMQKNRVVRPGQSKLNAVAKREDKRWLECFDYIIRDTKGEFDKPPKPVIIRKKKEKLTKEQVIELRKRVDRGENRKIVAKEFGVSLQYVYQLDKNEKRVFSKQTVIVRKRIEGKLHMKERRNAWKQAKKTKETDKESS
jgi:uncharacterized protein (DUF1697 family)